MHGQTLERSVGSNGNDQGNFGMLESQAHIAFHLTGRMPRGEFDVHTQGGLYPAILAGYRDLTALRYDFPVVLVRAGDDGAPVQSLSALVDAVVKSIAQDSDAERLKRHAIRVEREIRKLAAEGATGSLSELWDIAAGRIGRNSDELLRDSLSRLRAALKTDGEVIDCDKAMPFRLFEHAWQSLQDQKTKNYWAEINKLIMKLSDILSSDFVRSKEGLSAERLRASVGGMDQDAFDFDTMSRLLTEARANEPLPESRRQRVRGLLSILRSQRFFSPAGESDKWIGAGEPYSFVFENATDAVAAYRDRLPKMIELAKAIEMAKLEADGDYSEARHDAFFAEFGSNGLDPSDIAAFPQYLICLPAADLRAAECDLILQAFAAGLPAKVVVQTDDLLNQSPVTGELLFSGLRGRQLASTAMGSATCYVLQSSGSNLFQLREQVLRGLSFPGPALFNVYSGASATGIPPYLAAAAAAESRAFPSFSYDPSAGATWASRFSLAGNSQADLDWPVQRLDYEDEDQQLVSEDVAFTFVDFMACDPRCAKHFAEVPRARWDDTLRPVAELLVRESEDLSQVPCLLMVDGENRLQKVIVDEKLVRGARACMAAWHSLQELGGVHNSHAAALVERERKAWAEQAPPMTEQAQPPAAAAQSQPGAAAAAPAEVPAAPAAAAEATPETPSDEPYIETARCTSCNECTQINDKMFGYDANKQASIINPDAGTYLQLVEAAESCQVSIIHPGKPRNPNEPGLDELMKRAEPFL
jgi:ferredoxin